MRRLQPLPPLWIAPLLTLASLASGCDEPALVLASSCELRDEHLLDEPDGQHPDDVALAPMGGGFLALWSERAGLYARPLEGHTGAPSAPSQRLGPACDAGLAAASTADAVFVACARRGDDSKDDPGAVQVLRYAQGVATPAGSIGPTGPDGHGVAILADDAGHLHIAWQEARGARAAAWLGRLPEGLSETVSPIRFRAGAPSLAGTVRDPIAAWEETWIGRGGDVVGRIEVREGSRPPRTAAEVSFEGALPTLRGEGSGALLSFRDRRPERARPRVYLTPALAASPRVEPAIGMHANADGAAFSLRCEDSVFVIAPRTHSRHERLIALRRYSADTLEGQGPEHQVYQHGAAFELADARCVEHGLLLLYAGRESREGARASIRTTRLVCDADSGH